MRSAVQKAGREEHTTPQDSARFLSLCAADPCWSPAVLPPSEFFSISHLTNLTFNRELPREAAYKATANLSPLALQVQYWCVYLAFLPGSQAFINKDHILYTINKCSPNFNKINLSHFTQYCNSLCSQPLFSHLNCSKHLLRTQSAVSPLFFLSFPFPAPFFFLLPLSPFFCTLVSATSRVLCSHSPDQC